MEKTSYPWTFTSVGGTVRVKVTSGADIAHLGELDRKMWTVLSCPTRNLEFDQKTLDLLDTDHDGKMDLLIYTGSMPSTVSSTIPATNRIQVGANSLTLSEGDHGYITRDAAEDYVWKDRDYLYPVPLGQIQAYGGKLVQNPGWE